MLVTVIGASGSLGQVLVPMLFEQWGVDRVRVMSRGEHAQIEMAETTKYPSKVDFFVGDVRDVKRVKLATKGADFVFNLAAVKSVDKAEYNPNEAVLTNIEGAKNVIEACLENNVVQAVFTSSDKATAPLNLYGATKLAAEKLWIQSNSYAGATGTRFHAVRYGNVLGSNGSVIQKWKRAFEANQPLAMTVKEMTRYWMSRRQAAQFVMNSFEWGHRGEVFIPKMKAATMEELKTAFLEYMQNPSHPVKEVGIRPGEKMHESLLSEHELFTVTDIKEAWAMWPHHPTFPINRHGRSILKYDGFDSLSAPRYSPEELQTLIAESA